MSISNLEQMSYTITNDEIDEMIFSLFNENECLFPNKKRIKFSDDWMETTEKNIIDLNGSNVLRAISNTSTKLDNLMTSTSITYEKFSKLCKKYKIIENQEYEINKDDFEIDNGYTVTEKLKNIKKVFEKHVKNIKNYVHHNFHTSNKIENSQIEKLSKEKRHIANLYNREIEDIDVILKELDNPSKWISVLNFY